MARKVLAITISTTNIQVFRQHLLQCHHHDCTVVGFLREVSRALQRPPRKLQFCIQAKRKAAFPEALHMMRKANSILRPSTMLLQQQHRPLQYILTWLYTPFYVLFPRRAFFSLFIFCTVKSFFPSFFLHKGEDFVLCMCVGGIEPTNSPHEGQRKRPQLLLLFICNFTQRLIQYNSIQQQFTKYI